MLPASMHVSDHAKMQIVQQLLPVKWKFNECRLVAGVQQLLSVECTHLDHIIALTGPELALEYEPGRFVLGGHLHVILSLRDCLNVSMLRHELDELVLVLTLVTIATPSTGPCRLTRSADSHSRSLAEYQLQHSCYQRQVLSKCLRLACRSDPCTARDTRSGVRWIGSLKLWNCCFYLP